MEPERRAEIEAMLDATTASGHGWTIDAKSWDIECPSTDPDISMEPELIAMHIPEPGDLALLVAAPAIIRELLTEIDRQAIVLEAADNVIVALGWWNVRYRNDGDYDSPESRDAYADILVEANAYFDVRPDPPTPQPAPSLVIPLDWTPLRNGQTLHIPSTWISLSTEDRHLSPGIEPDGEADPNKITFRQSGLERPVSVEPFDYHRWASSPEQHHPAQIDHPDREQQPDPNHQDRRDDRDRPHDDRCNDR